MQNTLMEKYQNKHTFIRYRIDTFILNFATMLDKYVRESSFTDQQFQDDMKRVYEQISDIENIEIDIAEGLYLNEQLCTVSPQIAYLVNVLRKNTALVNDELCKKISGCKDHSASVILCLLYCVYGTEVLRNIPLYTRLKNVDNISIIYLQTYHSSYNTIGIKEILEMNPGNKTFLEHMINIIGELPEECITKLDSENTIEGMIRHIYGDVSAIPFNNFMVTFAGVDTLKTYFLQKIMETRDPKYVPAFKNIMKSLYFGDRQGINLFGAYIGGEFAKATDSTNNSSILYRYYTKQVDSKHLSDNFDLVLQQEKWSFRTLVKYGIGIGIQDNINITKRRYLKILAFTKRSGRSSGKGCIGPFIEVECPYISLKVLRRDINAQKPQR